MPDPLIDHVSLAVTDLERSRRFYDAALAPLGIGLEPSDGRIVAYHRGGPDEFLLIRSETRPVPLQGSHVCFWAPSRAAVREFHRVGIAASRTVGPHVRAAQGQLLKDGACGRHELEQAMPDAPRRPLRASVDRRGRAVGGRHVAIGTRS